jgi:hypothetical protein
MTAPKSLVADPEELEKFVEWLPPLKPYQAYLIQLMIRSTGLKEKYGFKGSDHMLMFRAVHGYLRSVVPGRGWELWRVRLLQNIHQLGILGAQGNWIYVKYKPGSKTEIEEVYTIPWQLLAIYIQVNASDVLKAATSTVKDVLEGLTHMAHTSGVKRINDFYRRPDTRYYSNLAKHSETRFHVVDTDTDEVVKLVHDMIVDTLGILPARIRTRRGVHYLIDLHFLKERNLMRKYAGPEPPEEVKRAMGEYKSKIKSVCREKPWMCEREKRIIERYIHSDAPLYHRIKALSIIMHDHRGVPLVELKKQALEPVPGTLYKGEVIVRFYPEEA